MCTIHGDVKDIWSAVTKSPIFCSRFFRKQRLNSHLCLVAYLVVALTQKTTAQTTLLAADALSVLAAQLNQVRLGGAIYNAGKMTMFEPADFRYNGGMVSFARRETAADRPQIVRLLARHGYANYLSRLQLLHTGNAMKMP